MSTYFESYTAESTPILQINDSYKTAIIKRYGTFKANYNNGVAYGFTLENDEMFAALRVDKGKLYFTPMVLYNGEKIIYVTCDSDTDIHYVTYSLTANQNSVTSGAGIEIYNADSKIVFSSNYPRIKIVDSIADYSKVSGYSIANAPNRYVYAFCTYWSFREWYYDFGSGNRDPWRGVREINCTGFEFSDTEITVCSNQDGGYSRDKELKLTKVDGNGSIDQIAWVYKSTSHNQDQYVAGIRGFGLYQFTIFDAMGIS